jgi:hypothetical protein
VITEEDKRYIAGILDGRGKILLATLGNAAKRKRICVSVGCTPEPVWQYLQEKATGSVSRVSLGETKKHLCTEHCTSKHVIIFQRKKEWRLSGSSCAIFLYNVKDYMLGWSEGHQAMLDFELSHSSKWKGATVEKMEALGWRSPV